VDLQIPCLRRSFQVLAIADIIRRERHDPPMTDEERQRAMDFIVAQQAKNAVEIEKLNESYRRAEHRFDRDERILKLIIRAGRRARTQVSKHEQRLREQHALFAKEMAEMREFQAHSDKRLDALIDIVRADHNGRSA
jgi:tellurite resistance protein